MQRRNLLKVPVIGAFTLGLDQDLLINVIPFVKKFCTNGLKL